MKKQEKQKLGLNKLTIASIDRKTQGSVNGGDCAPTEPTDFDHGNSYIECNTRERY